jgi:hypothetical protein
MNTKNMTLFLGVIFGISIYICNLYAIPSGILLFIFSIQTFEFSTKKKKMIEEYLNHKLKLYEEEKDLTKKDLDKLKQELDSLKSRLNVTQMYGQKTT